MLRRLATLLAVLFLGLSLTPVFALDVSYNNNVVLHAGVTYPTAQYSSTYTPPSSTCVPSYQIPNSIYNPGGPLLTPILNSWLYWGNAFNWTGNNCTSSYSSYSYNSRPFTPTYLSSGSYEDISAPYVEAAPLANRWDANYSATPAVQNGWTANYTPTVTTTNWNANYSPTVVTKNWDANYTPTVTTTNWNANYSPTVTTTNWDANYSPTITTKNWNANYTPTPTTQNGWTANYTPTPKVQNGWTANYAPAGTAARSYSNIIYPTGSTATNYSQVYAPYTSVPSNSGAAFGSLFGDGRDPAFGGSAVESFVARLRGQTSDGYTSRADSLSAQDYASYFDVNPVTAYTPVSAYDRTFSTPQSANLNATPTTGPATSGAAVSDAARSLSLSTPLQQTSTYAQDLEAVYSRSLIPAFWKNRAQQTRLTREDLATMLEPLRAWRDTGMAARYMNTTKILPVITDMKPSDANYFRFVEMANERILYMPDAITNGNGIVTAKADPKGPALRAQTLQAIMTALYLRPNSQLTNAGYTDLPATAWYTPWALTARSYGLDYGTRFDSEHVVTQEEAVHMIATLLKQIR